MDGPLSLLVHETRSCGFSQPITVRLPDSVDGVPLLRVSVQGYNTQQEVDALAQAVERSLLLV